MAISVATPVYDRKNESVRHFLKTNVLRILLFSVFFLLSKFFNRFIFIKKNQMLSLKKTNMMIDIWYLKSIDTI